jgi:hypothetical protein
VTLENQSTGFPIPFAYSIAAKVFRNHRPGTFLVHLINIPVSLNRFWSLTLGDTEQTASVEFEHVKPLVLLEVFAVDVTANDSVFCHDLLFPEKRSGMLPVIFPHGMT